MSYPDSVQYLYALGNELKAGAKFGLERMKGLLGALDHPEKERLFVHVAGTNGKGSTSAMIASILQQAGRTTGLYTSPHLIEPTERVQIDRRPVSAEAFTEAFQTVHAAAEELVMAGTIDAHPSYFETVTAMALVIFRQRVEWSVMEVGLGGRLDATNVITPHLCVITPVSYDHEAFLGNSLESIAAEKAGILKPGVPVVMARQEPAADAVIEARAKELGCKTVRSGQAKVTAIEPVEQGSRFVMDGITYYCPLAGRHQVENAVCAILAGRELGIPDDAIEWGLRLTRWPGRLEYVSRHPDFVLDGAHNPAGAAALAEYIRECCAKRPVWLVYGAMRDKAIDEVIGHLFPLADRLILTAPNFPRALRPSTILEMTDEPEAIVTDRVADAIEVARTAPRDTVVFFTGSLYLVGEARKLLAPIPAPESVRMKPS